MKKRILITLSVFILLLSSFTFAFSKSESIPVDVKRIDYGDFYLYEFDKTEALISDEVVIRFDGKDKIITSTIRYIPMSLFNFTSTKVLTMTGFFMVYDVITPDIGIGSVSNLIFNIQNEYRNLLPFTSD